MKLMCSIFLALILTGITNVQAASSGLNLISSIPGGTTVSASYDKTNSTINLNVRSVQQTEHALVVLTDRRGNIVFQDRAKIDSFGSDLEISLQDLQSGLYFLRVKSNSIDFSGRYVKE